MSVSLDSDVQSPYPILGLERKIQFLSAFQKARRTEACQISGRRVFENTETVRIQNTKKAGFNAVQ